MIYCEFLQVSEKCEGLCDYGEIGLSSKSSYVLSVCVTFWISSVIGDIKLHKTQQ